MAVLHVRNVPEDVHEELRARAKRDGRSISAETIELLRRALREAREREELLRDLERLREEVRWPDDWYTPEELIRLQRDAGLPS